eukprot:TRINITY_DN35286_c2_g1_i2.p1 TRINITY_DN35286_c2_g1~~TRINITY_DN35286_c2_g1_i2.p1  ORF type:complete len:1140 (+),score=366.04 TRINITY_DN35286_c2_g1_i2:119-3538(+)
MELSVTAMVDEHVADGIEYAALPRQLRHVLTAAEYEQRLRTHAIAHQWPYTKCPSDVRRTLSERAYYSELMACCRQRMLLYPYRFSEHVLLSTGVTPFQHYHTLLHDMMRAEKSYDALPNFTAIDCLRLTGVGRNQYIEMMNQARARKKSTLLRQGTSLKQLLPAQVSASLVLEPWWKLRVRPGLSVDRVLRECSPAEQEVLQAISRGMDDVVLSLSDDAPSTPREGTDPQDSPPSPAAGSAQGGSQPQWPRVSAQQPAPGRPKGAGRRPRASTAAHGDPRALGVAGGSVNADEDISRSFDRSATGAIRYAAVRVLGKAQDQGARLRERSGSLGSVTLSEGGECYCCTQPSREVHSLHSKGLVYVVVHIKDEDSIVVPTIKNFVMNRTTDDPFEKLLYDILVSVDERTSVQQLSHVLDKHVEEVRTAAAVYCLLGLAYTKSALLLLQKLARSGQLHDSWTHSLNKYLAPKAEQVTESPRSHADPAVKRVAFLFDSELTAYLMMGNLGGALKDHAVTLYEAGKMTDEQLDGLVEGLGAISAEGKEGEVRRYFDHAVGLRHVVSMLRQNPRLRADGTDGRLDLIRCESLNGLDASTRRRILDKNYAAIIAMTPLAPLRMPTILPNYFGSPIGLVASPWFRLFVAAEAGVGPRMVLLRRGVYLQQLPHSMSCAAGVTRLSMLTWAVDVAPAVLCTANCLPRINEELAAQPVLLIVLEERGVEVESLNYPFPYGPVLDSAQLPVLRRCASPAPSPQLRSSPAPALAPAPSSAPAPAGGASTERATPTPLRQPRDPWEDDPMVALVGDPGVASPLVDTRTPVHGSPGEQASPDGKAVGSFSPSEYTASEQPGGAAEQSPRDRSSSQPAPSGGLPTFVTSAFDEPQSWNPAEAAGLSAEAHSDMLMRWLSRRFMLHCSVGYVHFAVARPKPPAEDPGKAGRRLRRRELQAALQAAQRGARQAPSSRRPSAAFAESGGGSMRLLAGESFPPAATDPAPGAPQVAADEATAVAADAEAALEEAEGAPPAPPFSPRRADGRALQVYPVGLWFGVPLADPPLTERILAGLCEHNLLSRERMDVHAACMHKLAVRFMSFIDEHRPGDSGRLMADDAGARAPFCSKPQSPVPFPTRCLYFDGSRLAPFGEL